MTCSRARLLALALVAIGCLTAHGLAQTRDTVPTVVPQDKALPQGVVARLGSVDENWTTPSSVIALQYSPDGRSLGWMQSGGPVRIWDVQVGREVIHLAGPKKSFQKGFAFSPDGHFIAVGRRDDEKTPVVVIYQTETGQESARLRYPGTVPGFAHIGAIAFAQDSKLLATACHDGLIRFWDMAMKRPLDPIEWVPSADQVALTPDGRRVAVGNGRQWVVVWDVRTRQRMYTAGGQVALGVCCLAFSPDGRYLATGAYGGSAAHWNAGTGARIAALIAPANGRRVTVEGTDRQDANPHVSTGMSNPARCLAFSPDGRVLAVGYEDGTLRLWEVATGRERLSSKLPLPCTTVAFAPSGATLSTSGPGASVLVWQVKATSSEPTASVDGDALWRELAEQDAKIAYRAMRRVAADHSSLLSFLRERIAQERFDYDPASVRRWIAQLGSERFAEREQATAELRRVGYLIEADLRAAQADAPMPEVRSRLVRIVDDLAQLPDNPELLRLSRCLEVLEWNGSAEAELLIRGLAQLVPKARLAVDADLSIKRLKNHRR